MSITGSTRPIATRFALPFCGAAKSFWDRLSAGLQQPSYPLPVDERLMRDIGVARPEDDRFLTVVAEDALSNCGLSAAAFMRRIRRDALRRGAKATNC